MKALTVKEPWASLIADGTKLIENRSWFTRHRGRLAIHAGCAWERRAGELMSTALGSTVPQPIRNHHTAGHVLAIVELVDCVPLAELAQRYPMHARTNREHLFGPWCWVLDNVQPVVTTETIPGRLGLWNWEPDQCVARIGSPSTVVDLARLQGGFRAFALRLPTPRPTRR
jgi:hypothetical protein